MMRFFLILMIEIIYFSQNFVESLFLGLVSRRGMPRSLSMKEDAWQGALINPNPSPNKSSRTSNALSLNWKHGICEHKVVFEGVTEIRRFKFCGNIVACGLMDGRLCLIDLDNGSILDKFSEHKGEIGALDFDGLHICSGGADGNIRIYSLRRDGAKAFGKPTITLNKAHDRSVSGMRIIPPSEGSKEENADRTLLVSCGKDRVLACWDAHTGERLYKLNLTSAPLAMDYVDGYLALGLSDGRVIFLKPRTGRQVLQFQAHTGDAPAVSE